MTANQITKKLSKKLTADEMAQLQISRDWVSVWEDNPERPTACKVMRELGWGGLDNGSKVDVVPDANATWESITAVNVR